MFWNLIFNAAVLGDLMKSRLCGAHRALIERFVPFSGEWAVKGLTFSLLCALSFLLLFAMAGSSTMLSFEVELMPMAGFWFPICRTLTIYPRKGHFLYHLYLLHCTVLRQPAGGGFKSDCQDIILF